MIDDPEDKKPTTWADDEMVRQTQPDTCLSQAPEPLHTPTPPLLCIPPILRTPQINDPEDVKPDDWDESEPEFILVYESGAFCRSTWL